MGQTGAAHKGSIKVGRSARECDIGQSATVVKDVPAQRFYRLGDGDAAQTGAIAKGR